MHSRFSGALSMPNKLLDTLKYKSLAENGNEHDSCNKFILLQLSS